MSIEQIIFYFFSGLLIVSSSMVVTAKHSVRAVLFLVLAFFAAAVLWMLLEAEFLSIALVLVYVGAVMVLFLFVVMMLDVDYAALKQGFTRYVPLGLLVAALMFGVVISVVGGLEFGLEKYAAPAKHAADYSNIKTIGKEIYTKYLFAFELAAVILMVAIIAAISLTFRGGRSRKSQNIAKQVATTKAERLRIVSMPAEKNITDNHSGA